MCVAVAPFVLEMTSQSCEHVIKFKESKGTDPFRIIHSYFIANTTPESRKRKVGLKSMAATKDLLVLSLLTSEIR